MLPPAPVWSTRVTGQELSSASDSTNHVIRFTILEGMLLMCRYVTGEDMSQAMACLTHKATKHILADVPTLLHSSLTDSCTDQHVFYAQVSWTQPPASFRAALQHVRQASPHCWRRRRCPLWRWAARCMKPQQVMWICLESLHGSRISLCEHLDAVRTWACASLSYPTIWAASEKRHGFCSVWTVQCELDNRCSAAGWIAKDSTCSRHVAAAVESMMLELLSGSGGGGGGGDSATGSSASSTGGGSGMAAQHPDEPVTAAEMRAWKTAANR